ncbi:hypothetical protein HKCCSP123_15480 [Rhodobacterales bacterium HKCCSP123]|nr:hypothetical protein [Rhodobacterales bacterium HKCCSP123]
MLLWLGALQALAQAGATISNAHTGLSGSSTAQMRISDHPHHVLMGHVIHATSRAGTVRALVIGQRRDGVHRLWFSEAWSGGTELPYARTRGLGCTHGHCRDAPIGMIFLSAALFARAAERGLSARLVGPSGAIDIAVPAALFRAALAM